MPVQNYTIRANRWTMYRSPSIAFLNEDLTGAVFKMQVRPNWNNTTTTLANLGNAASSAVEGVRTIYIGTATVAAHIAAGRLEQVPPGYSETDSLLLSLVSIRINKATMNAFPYAQEQSDDFECVYDLWVTPSGGDELRRLAGPFIAEAGATQ